MNGTNSNRLSGKSNALTAGVFFIIAAVAAIIGLILYNPILNHADYLFLGERNYNRIVLGAFFELILACSAIGTGIMLYPHLRKFNEGFGLGYVCFRMLEVVFILVGIISVLSLLSLSVEFTNATSPDIDSFQTIGKILQAIHSWTFMLGPNFMLGINTFIYSYIFYQSKLVPKKIAIIGIISAIMIFVAAILEMFSIILQLSLFGALLGLPIFVYEMTLAVWLIRKGFHHEPLSQHTNPPSLVDGIGAASSMNRLVLE